MRTIYKYKLNTDYGATKIELGSNDIPRTVGMQGENIVIWFDVRRDSFETKMINRYFQAFITGWKGIPEDAVFIGTVFDKNQDEVLHVFEVFPQE